MPPDETRMLSDQGGCVGAMRPTLSREVAKLIRAAVCPVCGGTGLDPNWGPELAKVRENNACRRCGMTGRAPARWLAARVLDLIQERERAALDQEGHDG